MPEPPAGEPTAELLASVRFRATPEGETELAARSPSSAEPRPLGVTDLLNPRRALFRRLRGPAPIALDREARLERGRAWHRRLGLAVASEGRLEVRVRRGGLIARIDLLTDVPVEFKTGAGSPEDRPEQIEQLAVYCALLGHPRGRLVHLIDREPRPPELTATDVEFGDLGTVASEMERREAAIRAAVATADAGSLGRCRWFGAGCEYRQAGWCSCRGDEVPEPPILGGTPPRRTPCPELAARWEASLRSAPPEAPVGVERYRELLYPRRAYFDRRERRPAPAAPVRPPSAPLDAYERAAAALERGPVGELCRLPTRPDAPSEEVLGWQAAPCVVRSSRVRSRLTAEEILARFPQYVLDLGLRCAATAATRGSLVVGLEHAGPGEVGLQVFELEPDPGRFWSWYEARREALERAGELSRPDELPACPGWMATDCPYRDACGCGAAGVRAQR
jgi:hypothetical protein